MAKEPKAGPQETEEMQADDRVAALEEQVLGLMAQVKTLREPARHGLMRKDRVKVHNCYLREYRDDEEKVVGLVTRLFDWKERKDPEEEKRHIGMCKLEVIDPRTGKSKTIEGVNGLKFLNDALKVDCKIISREKSERVYIDPVHGYDYARDTAGNILHDTELALEVTYLEEKFTLEVLGGEFTGTTVVMEVSDNSQTGLNI